MAAPLGNRNALGNNGGRPPDYTDPAELQAEVNNYFEYIKGESEIENYVNDDGEMCTRQKWNRYPENPTITGLSLFLGFESRSTLYDYAKKVEFSYIIKRAMQMVEYGYETSLAGDKPTGAIFALKNMGWIDKVQQEMTGKDGAALIPTGIKHVVEFRDMGGTQEDAT